MNIKRADPFFASGRAGATALIAAALLGACATSGSGPGERKANAGQTYRCEHGIEFTVRFIDDSAVIDSAGASDVLFRDAGGVTPQQSVYSNARVRAEFGLGGSGREAVLRYPQLPLAARCVRDDGS